MCSLDKGIVITGGHSALAEAIRKEFPDAKCPGKQELDVTSEPSVSSFLQGEAIDLLICCAGLSLDAPLLRLSEADWQASMDVNLTGAARVASCVSRGMARRGRGHIIFIGSYLAKHPGPGTAAYSSAKAGLEGLTRSLAAELGASGIRVNLILPGFMETKMTARLKESVRETIRSHHCLKRFNTPDRVAAFIRCLHEELTNTSGQTFNLDSRPL